MLESEILEFVAHSLHAHASCEGRVYIERLLGDSRPLLQRHEMQRAHIVKTVREFDEKDANVFRYRKQKLSKILGMGRPLGNEVELFQFGQAVDETADVETKQPID